jgi:hypothetical protein
LCLAITTLLTIVNNFCGIMRPVASFRSNMIDRKCNHMCQCIWQESVFRRMKMFSYLICSKKFINSVL